MTMAVSEEVLATQVGILFQLASLAHNSPEREVEKARHAYHHAFVLIGEQYSSLPSALKTIEGRTWPAYELCTNDSRLENWHGLPVMSVWFTSPEDFTLAAVTELKALCVDLLEQVAAREAIDFRYVGMQRSRELKVRE
jgi:hypothetical protein